MATNRALPSSIIEIMAILPHRYPFLLVDKVVRMEGEDTLIAHKNVSVNEAFFQGHFPNKPVMPGVLQIEALAQAALLLAYMKEQFDPKTQIAYFAGIDGAKFKRMVVPGDIIELKVTWVAARSGLCKIRGVALVDGQVCAEADITAVARNL